MKKIILITIGMLTVLGVPTFAFMFAGRSFIESLFETLAIISLTIVIAWTVIGISDILWDDENDR